MDYITCERRKNAPQINVLICEKKCKHLNTCSTYLSYAKLKSFTASPGDRAPQTDELLVMNGSPRPSLPSAAGK